MLLFGLTGGVGMGKSTVAQFLAARGDQVVDTDEIARELVRPGEPALAEIRTEFGETVIDSEGALNRATLGALVFADNERRKQLESILHPRIRERWRELAAGWKREVVPIAVVVIPLLYETGVEGEFDRVICVACSQRTQERRLLERGWNREDIGRRIAAQRSVHEKMDRADGVIWNEFSVGICHEQARRLFR